MLAVRTASLVFIAFVLSSCAAVQPTLVSEPVQSHVVVATAAECIAIEDQSKERLDCYDTLPVETRITNCRLVREQDARLGCYNTVFIGPQVVRVVSAPPPIVRPPAPTVKYVRRGRGGCGSRGGPGYRLPNGKCASYRR